MLSFLTQPFQRTTTSKEHPLVTNNGATLTEFLPPKSSKDSFNMRLSFNHAKLLKQKQQGITPFIKPVYHWHWNQSEIFQIEKGAALLTLDGKTRRVTAADGSIVVPAGTYHTYDMDFSTGEDMSFVVWSPEEDGVEELFFRNFFSYLEDCQRNGVRPSVFQVLLFFHTYEVSFALPSLPKWLAKMMSKWGLGFIGGKVIGNWLLGYQSSYKEYVTVENAKTK